MANKERIKPFDPDDYDPNKPEDVERFLRDEELERKRQKLINAQQQKHHKAKESEKAMERLKIIGELMDLGIENPSEEQINNRLGRTSMDDRWVDMPER